MAQYSTVLLSMLFVSLLAVITFASLQQQTIAGRGVAVEHGPAASVIEPSAVEILERQLRESPQSATALVLHTAAGHLYRDEGQYEAAAQHYEAATAMAAHMGESEQLTSSLASLGSTRYKQGRLMDARHELEKAHALTSEASSSLRGGVAQSLGNVLRELGQYDVALQLYREAREKGISGGLLGSDVADALARRGDLDKALESGQAAVKVLRTAAQVSGQEALQEDLELGVGLSVLGSVQHAMGDLVGARESYRRALSSQRRLRLGHPDRVLTKLRQARLQRDEGDAVAALAATRALVVELKDAKREGREVAAVLALQGDLLREAGNLKEAEAALTESLAAHERCCGDGDQHELAVLLHILGSVMHDQRRHSAAFEKYKRSLEILLRTVGPMHAEVAAVHNSLGTLHQDLGEAKAAQEHFTKCLELQLQTLGPKNPEISNTYNNLATLLARRGERSEAAALLRKALDVLDAAGVPAGNPERAIYAENLAALSPLSMSV